MERDSCFHIFTPQPVAKESPERFTFPFFYVPHAWSIRAANLLINRLEIDSFNHDFGLHSESTQDACGKMFGVLVVENNVGQIGYLAAFSGKLGNSNKHTGFVPPLFDMLEPNGHYRKAEAELSGMNREIELLEAKPEYLFLLSEIRELSDLAEQAKNEAKETCKKGKQERAAIRQTFSELSAAQVDAASELLNKQSRDQQFAYKQTVKNWNARLDQLNNKRLEFASPIERLKITRKQQSAALQAWLFEQYVFLNQEQQSKSLQSIFEPIEPPSGAGECAAPKLLQHAFANNYRILCMAEFWWGKSPQTEIRTHRNFYPACRGKCLPILTYMLEGVETDSNPLLASHFDTLHLEILDEDKDLLVIHKPAGLLSVPGKTKQDSVYAQIKRMRPEASGPLIVHRLDRSTSGIMLIPKNQQSYHALQKQFIERSIEKRYVALVDGIVAESSGEISLPLRPDLDDRPRQLVCYEHGREAITQWNKVGTSDNQTKIHFYPKTGRTHQLRVHAAHPKGLNAAICGDELYGKTNNRLMLHAESITFTHPGTGKRITQFKAAEF